MRVVAAVPGGDFVQVAALDEPGCTRSTFAMSSELAKLTLFVRRGDLAPVVAKRFEVTYPDGTLLELRPGTPVAGGAVSLRGDRVAIDIPADSIGLSYVAPARAKAITIDLRGGLAIARGTKARLGDQVIALGAWEASAVSRQGATATVALADRCATAHVIVPSSALQDSDEDSFSLGGSSVGGSSLSLRDTHFIAAGTALSAGGRVVAYAATPIYLPAAPTGKQACFERKLAIDGASDPIDAKLRLCVPAASVSKDRLRAQR
jgi:hypothetical protein